MTKWITLGATDCWHPPCQANQKSADIVIFRHYRSEISERRGSSRSLFFNAWPCQKRKGEVMYVLGACVVRESIKSTNWIFYCSRIGHFRAIVRAHRQQRHAIDFSFRIFGNSIYICQKNYYLIIVFRFLNNNHDIPLQKKWSPSPF